MVWTSIPTTAHKMIKSNKRIAILCFSPYQGGMEIDSIRLYNKLKHIYDKNNIWLICKDGTFIHDRASHDKEIFKWCSIKFRSMFSFSLIFKLRDFIKKNNINNLIFFGASEMRSIYFAILGLNVNLIVRHGTTKSHAKKDIFHRLIYSKVSHYVGISKHLVNNINEVFPLTNKTKVNLIYSSLKFPNLSIRTIKEQNGVVNIIHVGRLTKGKGQDVAIRVCSALYDAGIAFKQVIVGSGDEKYKEMLVNMLALLPYKDSVVFHGYTEDVFHILGSSDVFLFPSAGEGLPNALIEALSCGLVCIVYSNTVFPEIFDLGFYGHVIENGNEHLLSKALVSVCKNIDREIESAKNNIDLAGRIFSEDREVAEYDKILI